MHYVGLDKWKVGRTAAWAIANICKAPGKLGILVGNHRYRCQEMNESGFRSYFREFAPEFTLLEPLSTFETSAVAQEMTEKLLREHPDLAGLYVAGGGITGVVAALRASGAGQRDRHRWLRADGRDARRPSRRHPDPGHLASAAALADETIAGMIRASGPSPDAGNQTTVLPFEIFTRENI